MNGFVFLLITLLNSVNSEELNLTTPLDDLETCFNSTCSGSVNITDIAYSKNVTSTQSTSENGFQGLNHNFSDNSIDKGLVYEGSGFERSKKELLEIDEKKPGNESSESYDESDEAHTFTSHLDEFNKVHTLEVLLESNENETELFTTTAASTVTARVTEKTVMTTNIPKVPTLSESVYFSNYQNDTLVCLCDLTVNQCDINCCCDKECSMLHLKVFTKCSDADPQYDSRYCFKNNFVFANNTNHKVIQNEGGLFCIVRDNSQLAFHYKTKEVMKTLESFNRSLPKSYYSFSKEVMINPGFITKSYKAGHLIWIIENGQIKPFGVPAASVGVLCSSQSHIKYLVDQTTVCSHERPQYEFKCGNSKTRNVLNYLRDIKIISNPNLINKSQKFDIAKICQAKTCLKIIPYMCKPYETFKNCGKAPVKGNILTEVICWYTVPKIHYRIWHNGSEGITKFEAFIWLRNVSFESGKSLLQTTEVKFYWAGSSGNIFERSGNPGYLTGKPLLAGRKVYHVINETGSKKEAIEMSINSDHWLNILGSEKGICSSSKRIPINFRENGQFKCSLGLTKDNFDKNECIQLQNNVFKLLIGDNITNVTNDNLYNKFVATFGNSKVEETGDWVQVLIDSFPLVSSQVGFKSNHDNLICKNMITDLIVDIAYSNIGSFLNPQSKVLGVSFRFGGHRDLTFYCDTRGCEHTTSVQYFKLSTSVHFIDLSEPALDAFAKPLGLEVKLPHDFFYPFFSKSSTYQLSNIYVFVLLLLALF